MNMVYVIMVPIAFVTLIMGVATQVEDIAHESSDKAIAFADDMNGAMDCATRGIPIAKCSPDLMTVDFSTETEEYLQALEEIDQELKEAQAAEEI